MSLVKGIHHVALKCSSEELFAKEKKFYGTVLGLEIARQWDNGIMFDTGAGIIEITANVLDNPPTGVIRHFALACDDPDACITACKAAGYEVFVEPKDIVIKSNPEFPARIAFCKGPLGEEIEFFKEY